MNASHYSTQGCKVQRVQELEGNINTHGCRSASAARQTTAQTILCIQRPLFPCVSIISQHYLFFTALTGMRQLQATTQVFPCSCAKANHRSITRHAGACHSTMGSAH